MTHRRLVVLLVALVLVAVPLPGCIRVTAPLSDPDKAEPDKRLLGNWESTDGNRAWEIDSPAVKGNPKGLMRAVCDGRADDPRDAFWFFTTTIGKDTYATIYTIYDEPSEEPRFADFREQGALEWWNKWNDRRYFIFRYVLDGDKLTVDGGDTEAMEKLVQAEKIAGMRYFDTRPGWLARYLEKKGHQTLYKGTNRREFQRSKKEERPKTGLRAAEVAEAWPRKRADPVAEAEREAERRRQAESYAGELIKSAKIFLAAGATDTARRRLQKVIDYYGDTKAAAEAEEMLKKLKE
jgi:hypothetical protein